MQEVEVDPTSVAGYVASALTNEGKPFSSTSMTPEAEVAAPLPRLIRSVFECPKITRGVVVVRGKFEWRCDWCGCFFPRNHVISAFTHMLKKICAAEFLHARSISPLIMLRGKFVAVRLSSPAHVLTHFPTQLSQVQGPQTAAGIKGHGQSGRPRLGQEDCRINPLRGL